MLSSKISGQTKAWKWKIDFKEILHTNYQLIRLPNTVNQLMGALNQVYGRESSVSKFVGTIQQLKDSMAVAMASSCSEFCQSANHGDGKVIGTAPSCRGYCGVDCPNTKCDIAISSWADYGYGCWTGNKVCCCGRLFKNNYVTSSCSLFQIQLS